MNTASRYHIHIDGKRIGPRLESYAKNLGFWWDNFLAEVSGADGYAPARHLTHKPKTAEEFRRICNLLWNYQERCPEDLVGYVECECIVRRIAIQERPFNPEVPFPFRLKLASLPKGNFRETEIHFSLNKERSDPRLLAVLKQAGFFLAFAKREHGTGAIFTAQGFGKDIGTIWPLLNTYLASAGGAVCGEVKEERIAQWWLTSLECDPLPYTLPPIVKEIVSCATP
jgi:hypothetical protein